MLLFVYRQLCYRLESFARRIARFCLCHLRPDVQLGKYVDFLGRGLTWCRYARRSRVVVRVGWFAIHGCWLSVRVACSGIGPTRPPLLNPLSHTTSAYRPFVKIGTKLGPIEFYERLQIRIYNLVNQTFFDLIPLIPKLSM